MVQTVSKVLGLQHFWGFQGKRADLYTITAWQKNWKHSMNLDTKTIGSVICHLDIDIKVF